MTAAARPPRLEVKDVTKAFPGVLANDRISFSAAPGAVHALLGENGAGKSTLVKIIYGLMRQDSGDILFDGEPADISGPKAARALGIGMVFQHFSLFEAMTVLENIALGLDEKLSRSALESRIRGVMDEYGLALDPHRTVSTLSVGERQRIEIVRTLLLEPRLLIMDEPTSVLTPQEAQQLFKTLRALAARDCAILYISHKLEEVRVLCGSATVLRGGRTAAECDPGRESARSLAEMMIGGELKNIRPARSRAAGPERLTAARLNMPAEGPFGTALSDISFHVRAGEIFGVAGVAGNGQNELLLALSGETPAADAGAVKIDGRPAGALGVEERRRLGLCAVPEERFGHAAVPGFTLTDNAVLTARTRKNLAPGGVINRRAAETFTCGVIKAFDVRNAAPRAEASSLSGGNMQKFIMGREIMQTPEVLVVSQPTWGVDAGAAAAIHQALIDLAARGSAVMIISQDLDELLALCGRMAVINEGRLSRTLKPGEASIDEIGLLMGGVHGGPAAVQAAGAAAAGAPEPRSAD